VSYASDRRGKGAPTVGALTHTRHIATPKLTGGGGEGVSEPTPPNTPLDAVSLYDAVPARKLSDG